MGFLNFFKSIGSGLKKAVNTIGGGLKSAAVAVYHKAIVPVYEHVIKPVYKRVIKPVGERAINFVSHGIDRVERIADAGVNAVEGAGDLFKGIGNTPVVLLGALGLGALLILK